MINNPDQAAEILGPYLPMLHQLVRKAVDGWMALPGEQRMGKRPTTRANWIYDEMVQAALRDLESDGIRMKTARGYLRITLAGYFSMKLNKLNKHLRPANVRTQAAQQFINQIHFQIDDAPAELTNTFLGYKWNATETEIDVYIVCPMGDNNQWTLQITADGSGASGAGALLPVAPTPIAPEPQRTRRRPVAKERPAELQNTGDA